MHPEILKYLCDPESGEALELEASEVAGGEVITGVLKSPSGRTYPIRNRVPRFVETPVFETVRSFGDQWNHFNFVKFKLHWLEHTVRNTFGTVDAFRGKTIVDAGGGSGAQSLWMLESGATRVIMLELSHSVDDVVASNIDSELWKNFDVIQCSIDQPPLKRGSIDGIVICHNVIQHTRSVSATANALYDIVAPGGEFVFNCYRKGRTNFISLVRTYLTYGPTRAVLRHMPFSVILFYSRMMGVLRQVPVLGRLLDKLRFSLTGRLPKVEGESWFERRKRLYRATVLNTFDMYGSHAYQHYLSEAEQRARALSLQPDSARILNWDSYFLTPQPTGCALRVQK